MRCCLGDSQLRVREMVPVASSGTITTSTACEGVTLVPLLGPLSVDRAALSWLCNNLLLAPTCKPFLFNHGEIVIFMQLLQSRFSGHHANRFLCTSDVKQPAAAGDGIP